VAASSLLALIDDIATILDDVAVMTKLAAKKTAGVLGDDLALNAEQVSGVRAERELPVVWAVAKGSALNKLILVPAALAISLIAPWAITPLLMLGGAFLCFEGFEKVAHKLLHSKEEDEAHHAAHLAAAAKSPEELLALEKTKIKGAVRTDFVLSAEIIVIALGTAAGVSFGQRAAVLCAIAGLMTVGVYGLVAGIVKLDDLGVYLMRREGAAAKKLGSAIVGFAPYLMKGLAIAGTVAMFTVGGNILVHGVPGAHEAIHHAVEPLGGFAAAVLPTLIDAFSGVLAGALLVGAMSLGKRVFRRPAAA